MAQLRKTRVLWEILLTILLLLMFEFLLRLSKRAPAVPLGYLTYFAGPEIPWSLVPFSSTTVRDTEFTASYKNNSLGFRDREHSIEKLSGTKRVLLLGDSFTYGLGAEYEQSFPFVLEKQLNSSSISSLGERFEVINMGVPSYYPELEYLTLKYKGFQFKPDLILVAFVPNDVIETYLGRVTVNNGLLIMRRAERLGKLGLWLYSHSHLVRTAYKLVDWALYSSTTYRDSVPTYDTVFQAGTYEKDWRKIESDYAQIANLAKRIGSKMGIIYIPQERDLKMANPRALLERLTRWAHQHDAMMIETLSPFQTEVKNQKLFYPLDGHCTPAGYHLIGTTVAETLLGTKGEQHPTSSLP